MGFSEQKCSEGFRENVLREGVDSSAWSVQNHVDGRRHAGEMRMKGFFRREMGDTGQTLGGKWLSAVVGARWVQPCYLSLCVY